MTSDVMDKSINLSPGSVRNFVKLSAMGFCLMVQRNLILKNFWVVSITLFFLSLPKMQVPA